MIATLRWVNRMTRDGDLAIQVQTVIDELLKDDVIPPRGYCSIEAISTTATGPAHPMIAPEGDDRVLVLRRI